MKGISILSRGFSVVFAIVYLAIASGVLPLVVAGVAAFSGEHRVRLQFAGDYLNVVLVHDRSKMASTSPAFARPAGHLHSGVTKLVCLLAERSPGHPDHVLHFAQNGNAKREAEITAPPVVSKAVLTPLSSIDVVVPPPAPRLAFLIPRSPPRPSDTILTLRSTVLVI